MATHLNKTQKDNSARNRVIVSAVFCLMAAATLSGCHAIQGFGKDITAVGQSGQDVIDDMSGKKTERY